MKNDQVPVADLSPKALDVSTKYCTGNWSSQPSHHSQRAGGKGKFDHCYFCIYCMFLLSLPKFPISLSTSSISSDAKQEYLLNRGTLWTEVVAV